MEWKERDDDNRYIGEICACVIIIEILMLLFCIFGFNQ